ncbi:PIG-L family deacetylase [Pararhizobium mangrovi]|nr:PIG-L family deacetylase [Pararhizobium mangrovi]
MTTIWGPWRERMADAPVTEAGRLVGDGALVVLSPHPDDETFGTSALISGSARAGRTMGIVAVTDGEASHRSPSIPRERLAEIRTAEQQAAVESLGVADARWLRLHLADSGAGRDPRMAEAAGRVATFLDEIGATALCAPHPDDPHPDHHATAALAEAVRALRPRIRLLHYYVWSMRLGDDEPCRTEGLTPFRLATDIEAKGRAIACHRSQLGALVTDDPEGFVLPEWFLEAQRAPFERYAWAAMPGALPGADHFADLYANDGDPWHVRSSRYEADKRADNIDQLSGTHHTRGLDVACGEGHLAAALVEAGVVPALTGIDRDPGIVARARTVHAGISGLDFVEGALPEGLPDGPFDLAIVSEILYFLDEEGSRILAEGLIERLQPGGDILVVDYLGDTGTPLSGRDAHDFFLAVLGNRFVTVSERGREAYRATLLRYAGEGVPDLAGSASSR